jgi:hypothetical protein
MAGYAHNVSTDLLARLIGQDPTGRDYVQRAGVILEPGPGGSGPIPFAPSSAVAGGLALYPSPDSLPPAPGVGQPGPGMFTGPVQDYTNTLPEPGFEANTFGLDDAPVQYTPPEGLDLGAAVAAGQDALRGTLSGVHDIEGPRSLDDFADMIHGRPRQTPADWSRNDPPEDPTMPQPDAPPGLTFGLDGTTEMPSTPLSFGPNGSTPPGGPNADPSRVQSPGAPGQGSASETSQVAGVDPETGMRDDETRAMSLMERILGPEDSDRRRNTGKALMAAGATIMSTGGTLGEAIGAGIQNGLLTYDEAAQAIKDEAMAMRDMEMKEEAHAMDMAMAELALARAQAAPTGGGGPISGSGSSSAIDGDLGELFATSDGAKIFNLANDLMTAYAMQGLELSPADAMLAAQADAGAYPRSTQLPRNEDSGNWWETPGEPQ